MNTLILLLTVMAFLVACLSLGLRLLFSWFNYIADNYVYGPDVVVLTGFLVDLSKVLDWLLPILIIVLGSCQYYGG